MSSPLREPDIIEAALKVMADGAVWRLMTCCEQPQRALR